MATVTGNIKTENGLSTSGPALAGLALSIWMASLGTSIANVALPTLARELGRPFQDVQWVVIAYLLATTALVVGAGRLGDLFGRRAVLAAGIALFTVASAAAALAPSLEWLVAARAVQGLGAAIMLALTLATASAIVPPGATGRAMGLLGTMSAIGTALGPVLGGVLIAHLGWRAIFAVQLPLGVLALALALRFVPGDGARAPRAEHAGFDVQGTLLLALTLTAYALAMTFGRGRLGRGNAALLLAALAGAAAFVRRQARAAAPLVRLALLRDPHLRASLAGNLLVSTVLMTTLVVGPFYLARRLGLDPAAVGAVMAVGPAVSALGGVPAGRLVDRLGAARVTLAGLAGIAAGAALLALLPATFGVAGYAAPLALLTAGYALFQAANNTAVMTAAGAAERGVVSGLLHLSRNLGLVTGASLMGAVFALAAGAPDPAAAPPAAVATGMRATFALAALLVVVSFLTTAAVARRHRS